MSKATLKGQTLHLEDAKEVSVVYYRCGFVQFAIQYHVQYAPIPVDE